MATRKKMNFRTKLTLLFLLIGIIPITLLGYLNFHYANKILKQQAVNQLISLREDRKAQLQSFFKHLRLDVKTCQTILPHIMMEALMERDSRLLIKDITEDVLGFAKSMDTRICFLSTTKVMF
jgi:methyl-accepting chemotaxis protein